MAYQDVVLADSPIRYWRLEETSGLNVVDQVVGAAGAVSSGTNLDVSGEVGSAAQFNGASGRIDTAGFLYNRGFPVTIEAWARTMASAPGAVYAESLNTAPDDLTNFILLGFNDSGNVVGTVYGHTVVSAGTYNDGDWHHVVAVFSSAGSGQATITVYVDGVQDGIGTVTAQFPDLSRGSMGRLPQTSPTYYLDGAVDELAVYNHVLSPARVYTHYIAATGVVPGEGVVDLGVGVDLAVTGAQPEIGHAAMAIGLDLNVSSAHPELGHAVMAVGVELDVVGSHPDLGHATMAVGVELDVAGAHPDLGHATMAVGADLEVTGSSPHEGTADTMAVGADLEVTGSSPNQGDADMAVGADLEVTGGHPDLGHAVMAVGVELDVVGGHPDLGHAVMAVGTDLEVTGARISLGQVEPVVGVDLAVTGGRPDQGDAAMAVGANLAVIGGRESHGDAAMAVEVDLAVTGWSTGCPVAPYPFSVCSDGC